jgi:hypothetical protein
MEFSKSLPLKPDFAAAQEAQAQNMLKQRPDKKPFLSIPGPVL